MADETLEIGLCGVAAAAPPPPSTYLQADTIADLPALAMEHGQLASLRGYVAAGDDGEPWIVEYFESGRSAVNLLDGKYLTGDGADDYYLSKLRAKSIRVYDNTEALVDYYLAPSLDPASWHTPLKLAIENAPVDGRVELPGVYMESTGGIGRTTSGLKLSGNGAKIKLTADYDYGILLQGGDQWISNLDIHGGRDLIPSATKLSRSLYTTGDYLHCENVLIEEGPKKGTAANFLTVNKVARFVNCTSRNPGRTCFEFNGSTLVEYFGCEADVSSFNSDGNNRPYNITHSAPGLQVAIVGGVIRGGGFAWGSNIGATAGSDPFRSLAIDNVTIDSNGWVQYPGNKSVGAWKLGNIEFISLRNVQHAHNTSGTAVFGIDGPIRYWEIVNSRWSGDIRNSAARIERLKITQCEIGNRDQLTDPDGVYAQNYIVSDMDNVGSLDVEQTDLYGVGTGIVRDFANDSRLTMRDCNVYHRCESTNRYAVPPSPDSKIGRVGLTDVTIYDTLKYAFGPKFLLAYDAGSGTIPVVDDPITNVTQSGSATVTAVTDGSTSAIGSFEVTLDSGDFDVDDEISSGAWTANMNEDISRPAEMEVGDQIASRVGRTPSGFWEVAKVEITSGSWVGEDAIGNIWLRADNLVDRLTVGLYESVAGGRIELTSIVSNGQMYWGSGGAARLLATAKAEDLLTLYWDDQLDNGALGVTTSADRHPPANYFGGIIGVPGAKIVNKHYPDSDTKIPCWEWDEASQEWSAPNGSVMDAADLGDNSHYANTVGKYEGKCFINASTGFPVYATGSGPSDTWVHIGIDGEPPEPASYTVFTPN